MVNRIAFFWFSLAVLALNSASAAAFERRTAVVEAVEKAGSAVVNIRTERIVKRSAPPLFGFSDPFFDEFFRDLAPPRVQKTQSLGSGVIIDAQGHVLTNAHVVEKASRIFVALPERTGELEAVLVGKNSQVDLAVLRIEGDENLPYLSPGRSDDLMVGETVIAIGNPLGLGHSITTGVVSASRRRIPAGDGMFSIFIQTDALINPGNSGGPLININGQLIGINTAIVRQAQGIGFAIPIDTAKRIMDDLITHGRVRPAFLGIMPGDVGPAFVEDLGRGGVLIEAVEPDSPASSAGLRAADVILSLDGGPVTSRNEFLSLLRTYTPGEQIVLRILRQTRTMERELELAPMPPGYGLEYGRRVFGMTPEGTPRGVFVARVEPGSAADRAGIRPGDAIVEIAGMRLESVKEYVRAIEELIGRRPVEFLIARGGRGYFIDLP